MTPSQPDTLRRIGWLNISLAIAFLLSFYFSPGSRVLRLAIDLPVLQSISVYKAHLLIALANYWIVAFLAYLGLRATKAELWLKPRPAIHMLIGLGNALWIIYVSARILASLIQGGGPSFVVASFGLYFLVPAQVLFLIGFVWLAIRSVSNRREVSRRLTFDAPEYMSLAVALAVPAVYASMLYFGEFRIAREADRVLATKCKIAGERIHGRPSEEVRGLFFERDGGERYDQIKDGIYGPHGSGVLGVPMVNTGLLMFMETPNDRPRPDEGGQFKYRRHGFKDLKGRPVNEIESEYGLYYKDLTTEPERKLGVRGAEFSIRHIKTNDLVATTTYFVSSRQRRFCGEAPNGSFSVTQFAVRALELKKRYPSIADEKSSEKRSVNYH